MNTEEAAWLDRFSGGKLGLAGGAGSAQAGLAEQLKAARRVEEAEEQSLKELLLTRATKAIEADKETLRKAFDREVEVDGKAMPWRDKEGRQERAFDTEETSKVTKGNSMAEYTNAERAMSLVVKQKETLTKATVERTVVGKKGALEKKRQALFTDKEIMDELYTPLVRQLILPESFVPKRYSATQKMADGSNDYYIKECKAKGEKLDGAGIVLKGAAIAGKGLVSAAATAASAVDASMFKDPTLISTIAAGSQALLNAGIDGLMAVANREFKGSDLSSIGANVSSGIASILTAALLGQNVKDAANIGKLVGAGISAAISATSVVKLLYDWRKDGGDFPIDAMINELGNAIKTGIATAAGGVGMGATKASDAKDDHQVLVMKEVGVGLTTLSALSVSAFKVVAQARSADIVLAIRTGQYSKIESLIVTVVAEAGKDLVVGVGAQAALEKSMAFDAQKNKAIEADPDHKEEIKAQYKTEAAQAGKADTNQQAKVTTALDSEAAAGNAVLAIQAKMEQQDLEQKKADQAKQAEMAQEMIDKERKEFIESLNQLGTAKNETDAEFKSIAKLIEKIERDRLIMNALAAIGTASASVAAAFFAPLNVAGELIKFLVNSRAAIDRAMALRKWVIAKGDSISAVSPYTTSIKNFIQNQAEQFAHYTISAAINALKIGADIAANFHPAAKGVSIGLAAVATLEDVLYQFYKLVALKRAWIATRTALENPDNRKQALIARGMNPTLAKYTIAYGALIEKSPVAITAMSRIGLDRETLSRAGDKVGDVKKYLQTLYNEDNVVLGKLPDEPPGKKQPPAPALTLKAWAASYAIWAEQDGLATPNPPALPGLLQRISTFATVKDEVRPIEDFPRYLKTLRDVVMIFTDFRPATSSTAAIASVSKAIGIYKDLADAQLTLVEMAVEAREGAQPPDLLAAA